MIDTPSHKYLPYLDGWRGVAILMVLLHHFAGFGAGSLGVQVFFVLSGKLMSQVLFVDRTPLGVFYQRRVARVFPLIYLYLFVIALTSLAIAPGQPLGELLYSATFLRTYLPGQSIWATPLPTAHLWTLNVEEHSYVLLSLIALSASRSNLVHARYALPALTLACLAAYGYYSARPPPLSSSPAMLRTECAAFPLMLSASLHLWLRHPSRMQFWASASAVVSLFAVYLVDTRFGNVLKLVLIPAALAVLLNVLSAAPRGVHQILSAGWLRWFGVVSFSLYVWNSLFLWFSMRGYLSEAQAAILSVLVGALSYYYFEAPCRALIRKGFGTTRAGQRSERTVVAVK